MCHGAPGRPGRIGQAVERRVTWKVRQIMRSVFPGNRRAASTAAMADLISAAATWNDPNESLESVNARIHDGVPANSLMQRADGYAEAIFTVFRYIRLPHHPCCLEIGSGTGYIMEAMHNALTRRTHRPISITGLDIAENMLAKAELRLGGKGPFRFMHYDGITVPLPDRSLDLIYSVAALQHIPKPYVYNLFFEMHRLLKPTGFAAFHLISFNHMSEQERHFPWRDEIGRQIRGETGHWHHFYSRVELENVLKVGTGFRYVDVREDGQIWVCVHKSAVPLPADFDRAIYLEINPDVAGSDPAQHWSEFGYREGRSWKR
jgi:ubiquinone/menaquinone biosynthesis C-methylase UbiE